MSFILDALKKSETERQEQGPAEFANVPAGSDEPRAPRWLWVLAGLLAINGAVLIGLLLRNDTAPVAPPTVAAGVAADAAETGAASRSFVERLDQARAMQLPKPAPQRAEPPVSTPTVTAESATPAAPPERDFTLRALPTADELRANGSIQMAELHLDIHVYSDTPSDRFVFINRVRHEENSRLAEGPVVREITPEGVILDYRGTEFLLPRE